MGGDLVQIAHRFRQAIDRARTIVDLTFRDSKQLCAVISYFGGKRPARRHHDALVTLKTLGFDAEIGRPQRLFSEDSTERETPLCRYWHGVDFENEPAKIEALLWTAIAREMRVAPNPRWLTIHIVDFDKRVALHVYDDRGADVFGMDQFAIKPLHEAFGSWLLEHDRAAITAKFSDLPA